MQKQSPSFPYFWLLACRCGQPSYAANHRLQPKEMKCSTDLLLLELFVPLAS
ncbi:hypothetical protein LguiB_030705 [Lonicera macranthoides]